MTNIGDATEIYERILVSHDMLGQMMKEILTLVSDRNAWADSAKAYRDAYQARGFIGTPIPGSYSHLWQGVDEDEL